MFSAPPPPIISPKSVNFIDFDPLEVARQVCLFEWQMFARIGMNEYF